MMKQIPWYHKASWLAGAAACLFFGGDIIRMKWVDTQEQRREQLSRLEQQAQSSSQGETAKGQDYWSPLMYGSQENASNRPYADNQDDKTADETNAPAQIQKTPMNIQKNSPKYNLPSKTNLPQRSRGVKNKNPGNIKIVPGKKWAGQIGRDGEFAVFKSHEYGLRAIGKNLRDQERMYGNNTVKEMITSWAPRSDKNDTNSYIAHVSRVVGSQPNAELDLTNKETVIRLMAAIAKRDSGATYSRQTLERAYNMLPAIN
jgi:hypothetical protein